MSHSLLDHPLQSCIVKLVESPLKSCNVLSNVNYELNDSPIRFASKRLLRKDYEWLIEVVFLGQLSNPNLGKLIGYCREEEHRLLVCEYMLRRNLENKLFKKYFVPLAWFRKMKIVLGTAKGLAYLHEAEKPVIYRDFKASNILLNSI